MRLHRVVTCVLALCACPWGLAQHAAAQGGPQLRPNTRARVVALDSSGQPNRVIAVGRLQQLEGDTVVILSRRVLRSVHIGTHQRLEVSNPRRHVAWGALAGFAAGVGVGAILPCKDEGGSLGAPTCADVRPIVAGLLGLLGAVLGAAVGYEILSDDWQPIGPRSAAGPSSRYSAQVGVSFAFR
jgi:hypothetical protein